MVAPLFVSPPTTPVPPVAPTIPITPRVNHPYAQRIQEENMLQWMEGSTG